MTSSDVSILESTRLHLGCLKYLEIIWKLFGFRRGYVTWPARLLTILQLLLAILGAAATEERSGRYAVLSAALLASIVLGLETEAEESCSKSHILSFLLIICFRLISDEVKVKIDM